MNGKVKRSSFLYTDTISVQAFQHNSSQMKTASRNKLQTEHPPTKQQVGCTIFGQSRLNCKLLKPFAFSSTYVKLHTQRLGISTPSVWK